MQGYIRLNNKKLVITLFHFLIFFSSVVFSQGVTFKWNRIGPWGGDIKDIKIKRIDSIVKSLRSTPSEALDSIYVASYGAGVYITDSSASAKWISRNAGLPTRKVLCFSKRRVEYGDTLYVGLDGDGVYKTTNSGISWIPAYGSGSNSIQTRRVFALAATPDHYDTLVAATDQGLWYTINGGNSWTVFAGIPTGITYSDVVISEYRPVKIYASSGTTSGSYLSKLYYTGDFGSNWWDYTINTAKINCLTIASTSTDTVYCGLASGKLFELTSPTSGSITKRIIRDDANYPILSIDLNPTIDTTQYDETLNDAKVNSSADTILLGTKGGFIKLIKKPDNTYTATQINTGLTNSMVQKICYYPSRRHPFYTRNNYYFLGTKFDGFFRLGLPSTTVWEAKNDSLPVGGLRVLSASPLNSNVVYAGGGYNLGMGYDGNGAVWRSTNASSNASDVCWTRVFPNTDTTAYGRVITGITSSYANPNIIWVSDSLGGIYRTTNGGESWVRVYDSSGVSCIHVRRFYGSQPLSEAYEYVYAARRINANYYIYRATGTTTFYRRATKFISPITSIITDSSSSYYVYATTWGSGVYLSTDQGVSFSKITNSMGAFNLNVYSLAVDSSSNELTIGTELGIYRSTDRGVNWFDDNSSTAGSGFALDKVPGVFAVRDTVWAAVSGKGIYYRTLRLVPPKVSTWTNAYTDYGPGYGYPFSPYDSMQFRSISMMHKWNSVYNSIPIQGYAVSESYGVFRRINDNINIPFYNGSAQGSVDSIYVYIPDTCSAIRGGKVDIPIRIRNAAYVDSFRVTVHVPIDYFISIDTTITQGTLTNTRSFKRYVNPIDNGMCRWVFNSTTAFSTNADTILFKVRYNIDNQSNIGEKNDSLPRYSNLYDSSIHLCSARLDGSTMEDSTDFLWRFTTVKNKTFYGTPGLTDSIGIFWLRRLPDYSTDNNGLPGTRNPIEDDIIDTTGFSMRGNQGNFPYHNANFSSDHDWEYSRGSSDQMVIYIKRTANPTYPYLSCYGLQERQIRTGDAIGAFYYKSDSLVCGGWGTWRADSGCAFVIYGDDGKTNEKDGFIENEQINFKIYDSRYKKVWSVPSIYTYASYGTSTFSANTRAEFDKYFEAKSMRTMYVDGHGPSTDGSRGGWHLVSSYIYPTVPNSTMIDIFKDVYYFVVIKDMNGKVYWPLYGADSLLNWDITKAYWIYLSKDDYNRRFAGGTPGQLALFKGPKLDPAKHTINFPTENTWYLIPYLGNTRTNIISALSTITGNFTVVIDDSGSIYWPASGVNQIGTMVPGKGYAIYMNAIDSLIYPSSISTSFKSLDYTITLPEINKTSDDLSNTFYKTKGVSPSSHILLLKFFGRTLRDGDEVGVFSKSGLCVGSAVYKKQFKNNLAVTVFGNDETIAKNEKTGAENNEELFLKFFIKNEEKEIDTKITNIKWLNGKDDALKFKSGSITEIELNLQGNLLPTEYSLEQNFPNPFNPITTIRYSIPENGKTKLKIYDLLGREVRELINSEQPAGYYSIEWDGKNNSGIQSSSGVYLYRLESGKYKKTHKMILVK